MGYLRGSGAVDVPDGQGVLAGVEVEHGFVGCLISHHELAAVDRVGAVGYLDLVAVQRHALVLEVGQLALVDLAGVGAGEGYHVVLRVGDALGLASAEEPEVNGDLGLGRDTDSVIGTVRDHLGAQQHAGGAGGCGVVDYGVAGVGLDGEPAVLAGEGGGVDVAVGSDGGHLDAGDALAGGLVGDLAADPHRAAGAVAGVGDDHGQPGEVVDDTALGGLLHDGLAGIHLHPSVAAGGGVGIGVVHDLPVDNLVVAEAVAGGHLQAGVRVAERLHVLGQGAVPCLGGGLPDVRPV